MEILDSLYIVITLLVLGIAALVWSADRFVEGAAAIANHYGLSPLMIGLTIVSIGTSAPEILVSANAALDESSGLAVGNALGSNLANVGLVLAITALIAPIAVKPLIARTEVPIMLGVTLLAGCVLANSYLGRWESVLLLLGLAAFMLYLIIQARKGSAISGGDIEIAQIPISKALLITLAGLVVLLISSRLLVWSASEVASRFGVSDLVIGLTVVAVGTSLPELAASLTGALKGHSEMALGNVLGSNIFNLLAVLPVAGIIYPMFIDDVNFMRDFGTVLFVSLLLGLACIWSTRGKQTGKLGRPLGIALLATYVGYYCWLLV